MDTIQLWRKRWQSHTQKQGKYFSLIGSSLFYSFLFAFSIGGYYYSKWLRSNPSPLFSILCIAVVLSAFLTRNRVRTFLKEADLVFLLTIEEKLHPYFQRSLLYSYILHCFLLLLLFLILLPLYLSVRTSSLYILPGVFCALLLLKGWNLYVYWIWNQHHEQSSYYADHMVRFFLNFNLLYFVMQNVHAAYVVCIISLMFVIFLFSIRHRRTGIY